MVEYSAFNRFVLGSSPRQPNFKRWKIKEKIIRWIYLFFDIYFLFCFCILLFLIFMNDIVDGLNWDPLFVSRWYLCCMRNGSLVNLADLPANLAVLTANLPDFMANLADIMILKNLPYLTILYILRNVKNQSTHTFLPINLFCCCHFCHQKYKMGDNWCMEH